MASTGPAYGFTTRSETAFNLTSMRLMQISDSAFHEDLLSFLSAVQSLEVDILPLVWYPALKLGRGGYAVINQSLVNDHLSFAFKRLADPNDRPDAQYQSLRSSMTELAILRHGNIRKHPNIIDLEGVCWEVNPSSDCILPVLVFEKAHRGSLLEFRDSEDWKNFSVEDKLGFCKQIVKAISILHASRVVHGDIKPDNILVFIDNDGIPLAKVADLGSSIIGESEHDLCYPPRSDPWTAPEHHHRGVSIAAAKTMDIYSLSFTCLWLLLDDRHGATTGKEAIEILWQLKDLDGLTKRACDTVESLNVSMTKEEGMKQFFNLTLATDPKARVSDVRQLMKYLKPNNKAAVPMYRSVGVVRETYHLDFKISSNLYPLLFTNYLVRKLVFQCLQYKAKSSECDTCAQRAAFELAFCYHIGLGVERSPQSARYWARQSGEELETLEDEMDEVIDIFIYQNKKVIELGLNGFSMIMDHVNEYRQADYDLEAVQTTYKREIKDLTVAFEEDPLVTVTLRATLGNILQGAGKFGEAEELYKELISFFDNSPEHGSASPSALTSRHHLANLFREQGRLSEAEELIEAIVNRRKELFGSQNPDVLDSMATLGSILHDARKLEKATTLFRIVRETSAKVFGDEHPRTLIAMSNLACACRDTGLLHEAEELDLAALTIKRRLLDDGLRSHYSTLTSMANLALTYSSQGRWDKAEELETQVIEERSKTLGDQHHATLTARGNLALTYYNQGRLEEAELLQEQVLEGRQQVLGNDHPQTLIIIDQLAETRQSLRHIEGL